MNTETIVVDSIRPELIREAENMRELATGYQITCPELRQAASDDLKRIKTLQRSVEDQRTEITGPINKGLRRVNEMFRKPAEWLIEAESILKRACLKYDHEQDVKRRAEAAEAARAADAEKKRLEEIAARERLAGNIETAQAIQEAAAMTAPVPVLAEAKIAGESHREVWRAEVVDIVALCKAVAEGRAPASYVSGNMTELNASARAFKGALAVDGVRASCERILASRAA